MQIERRTDEFEGVDAESSLDTSNLSPGDIIFLRTFTNSVFLIKVEEPALVSADGKVILPLKCTIKSSYFKKPVGSELITGAELASALYRDRKSPKTHILKLGLYPEITLPNNDTPFTFTKISQLRIKRTNEM